MIRNLIGKMFKVITICFEQAPLEIFFFVTNDFSNFLVLLCFVILPNVGHKTKVAHIYLHTHLLMDITITILSISRPPLNYAAVFNYLQFVFVVCRR